MEDKDKRKRKLRGYIHKDVLNFTGLYHYQRALDAKDLYTEEIAYQRVFHHKDTGELIAKEIFQKQIRGFSANTDNHKSFKSVGKEQVDRILSSTDKSIISSASNNNSRIRKEFGREIPSISSISITQTPEDFCTMQLIIEEILETLNETQKYIFAFILKVSQINHDLNLDRFEELVNMINTLSEQNINSKVALYKFLGGRNLVDQEWSKLLTSVSCIFDVGGE